jgi:hypothetical protein
MNTVQMNTAQSTQPDFASASSLSKPSTEPSAPRTLNLKNGQRPAKSSWLSRLSGFAFARHVLVLLIGVAITLAWQTYGDAARHLIASAAFSLDQQQFNTLSVDLHAMRQSIDGLASSIADNQEKATRSIADNQERIMGIIDQVIAGQVQMTREIDKLQALEQSVSNKSDASLRSASAPVPKPILRPTQAPTALTPARNP